MRNFKDYGGVAFNASSFLPKSDSPRRNFVDKIETRERYTGPVLIDRSRKSPNLNDSTRTGGLPFGAGIDSFDEEAMSNRIDAHLARNQQEPDPLPVLPKGQPPFPAVTARMAGSFLTRVLRQPHLPVRPCGHAEAPG